MPLLKGRFFVPPRPPVQRRDDAEIFTIPYSGDQFDSKEEYENYKRLYEEPVWTCQCTGHINMTYEEASNSEEITRKAIGQKFPLCFEQPVLELVHHNTETLDALVEKSSKSLYEYLVVGEPVTFKFGPESQRIKGLVAKLETPETMKTGCSPSSDKENKDGSTSRTVKKGTPLKLLSRKYSVKLREEEKIINGIPAEDLMRELKVPNRDILKLFIRCFASRGGTTSGSPWIVDDEMQKKHQIAHKLADVFLATAKMNDANNKAFDEALKEVAIRRSNKRRKSLLVMGSPVRYGSGKKTMLEEKPAPNLSKATKNNMKKVKHSTANSKRKSSSSAKGKGHTDIINKRSPSKGENAAARKIKLLEDTSSDEELSLAQLKKSPEKLTSRKSRGSLADKSNTTKKGSRSVSPDKLQRKKFKQATLFDLKGRKLPENQSRASLKSPTKSVPSSPRQPPIVHRLLKALKQSNSASLVAQLTTRCAKELSERQRQSLPEEVHERIQERWAKIQEKKMIEKMSPDERERYLKKKHKDACKKAMDKMKIMRKKFEDTQLRLKPLPSPELLSTPDDIPNELFGDIVMMAEFLNCYKPLLMPEAKQLISAVDVMEALSDRGHECKSVLGQVLTVFLQTLLQDTSTQGMKEFGFPLSDIPVNSYTAGELVRLYITHESSERREDDSDEDEDYVHDQHRQVPEEILGQLETAEVYELHMEEKLTLLLGMCDRVLASYTMQDYLVELQNDASELWRTRNQMLKEKNDLLREEKLKRKEQKVNTSGRPKEEQEENVSAENEDLASTVKRRRAMSAKAQEEKKKEQERKDKEADEQRRQRDMEELEKEFTEGVQRAKLVMRQTPLGTDRNHDRYWFFPNSFPGVLVEKGWVCNDITYSVHEGTQSDEDSDVESSSESEAEEENRKPARKGRVKCSRCLDKTVPHRGQNLWFVYNKATSVDALVDSLHQQGTREGRLKEQLKRNLSAVKSSLTKSESNASEEPPATSIDAFKAELEELELRLRNGGLGGVSDPETWKQTLNSTTELAQLGICLIEVQQSIVDKFAQGILTKDKGLPSKETGEKTKTKTSEEQWQEAVQNCTTFSRLHVLLGILDSSIKWEKSAENAKCKICRRKDENSLLLCDDCNQAFHMYCLRPALVSVPEGDWFCAACAPNQRRARIKRCAAASAENSDAGPVSDTESLLVHEGQCAVCGANDDLHACATCPSVFHLDCHEPPLRRPPRNTWRCMQCVSGIRIRRSRRAAAQKRKYYSDDFVEDWEDEEELERKRRKQAKEDLLNGNKEDTSKTRAERYRKRCWSPTESNSDTESVGTEPSYPAQSNTDPNSAEDTPKSTQIQPQTAQVKQEQDSPHKLNGHVDIKQMESKHMADILGRLRRNKHAWPFQDPVDPSAVPDYYEIIQEPIDFKSMKAKLDCGAYADAQPFVNDVALLFNNCELYNKPDTVVFKCIAPLEKIFRDNHRRLLVHTWYPRDGVKPAAAITDHDYI